MSTHPTDRKFAPEVRSFLAEWQMAARAIDVLQAKDVFEERLNDLVEHVAAFAVAATARRLGVSAENAGKAASAFLADRELDTTPARPSHFLPPQEQV